VVADGGRRMVKEEGWCGLCLDKSAPIEDRHEVRAPCGMQPPAHRLGNGQVGDQARWAGPIAQRFPTQK
jgi:hypothetical protein